MIHGTDGFVFDEDHMHMWCKLMLGSLHQLRLWLECENLDDMTYRVVTYILDRELYTFARSSFNSQDLQLLTFFAENYFPTVKPIYTCNPPNHPVSIFNWELTAVLLSRVGKVKQELFLEHFQQMTYQGANIVDPEPAFQSEEPLMFVDSHFHLDQILQRVRLRNILHLQSVVAPSCAQGFYYGIGNYIFLSCWNNWRDDVGYARGVYVCFGMHPHLAADGITRRQLTQLDSLTDSSLCVAIYRGGRIRLHNHLLLSTLYPPRTVLKHCHTISRGSSFTYVVYG